MDNQGVPTAAPEQTQQTVSFPNPQPRKRKGSKWPFAVGGVLLILGIGGFLVYRNTQSGQGDASPSPFVSGLSTIDTPDEPTSTPTPSAQASASPKPKTEITIEVQNGTGTTGDAAVAKKELATLGYTKVETGNAPTQDATSTSVLYAKDIPLANVNEIVKALESVFTEVSSQKANSLQNGVIRVITGPKKAGAKTATPATAKPTTSASPAATKTPTPTPTASVSPSPTSTQ